jgi:uncharacterized repeat protein (TIGR01451 family)
MAGKMQFAAKLFLGTTVLASGGAGTYYYAHGGWPIAAPAAATQEAAGTATDLDAVASAWAEPAASKHGPPIAAASDRSAPSTKSATKGLADAPAPTKSDESDDRYSAKNVPAAHDAAATDRQTDREPELASEAPPSTDAKDTKTKPHVDSSVQLAAATDSPEPALARGQEPHDLPATTRTSSNSADIGAALNAVAGGNGASGNSLRSTSSAQQPNTSLAVRQVNPASNNPTPPTANQRYGDSATTGTTPTDRGTSPLTNPFNAAPAPAPNVSSEPKRNNTIEPLQMPPSDVGGGFSDAQRTDNGLRPLSSSNTPQVARNNLAKPQSDRPIEPLRSQPNSDVGSTLPIGSTPPTGIASPLSPNLSAANETGAGKPGEKALEGPQQPSLVIQKFAPGEVQVGKPAKFIVQIRNAGRQAAEDVVVRDEVPQGTQLVSTSPNATNDGGHLAWQLGKLSPGEDRTVEMQLMPTAEGDIGSVATVSYASQASVKTHCTMPQLAIRMTAPTEVMIGNEQHVKIELRNPGSGDATGVMLLENVPPQVKHAAGPALEFEIGTLRAGETRNIDLVLTAEKAGKVVNTLTARAEGNLQVQQQVEFEVIAPALSVAVDGPERRYLERPATYEVSVENPGTAPAHNVQIVTKLPKGLRFVRANNMGEYDATSHAVYWSLAELPKGEKGTVELVAMPIETGPQTLQVEGHAQQGLADQKQRDIVIEGIATIMFEVKDLEDPIEVGGETGYEIRVVNQGTKAAENLQVSVELPPGMKFIRAEGETQFKNQEGRIVFDALRQLAPKADTVFRIRAQGVQPGDQRVTVQVNTADLEHPIRREESTRVFGDQ